MLALSSTAAGPNVVLFKLATFLDIAAAQSAGIGPKHSSRAAPAVGVAVGAAAELAGVRAA